MSDKFERAVKRAVLKWEEIYHQEVWDCNYRNLHCWNVPDLPEDEADFYAIEQAEEALDAQIRFIKYYVAFMMIDGDTRENLKRIKRFLSYQHCEERYFPNNRAPAFRMDFWGGCSGLVTVKVEEIHREFDFADSWAEERYQIITIYNYRWKKWTKKRIDDMLNEIQDDFEFDGYKVRITLEDGKASQPAKEPISVQCKVYDD